MNQNQPPSDPQSRPHICFSGSLSCSGAVPCDACLLQVRTWVLPIAIGQAQAFFEAFMQRTFPHLYAVMLQEPSFQECYRRQAELFFESYVRMGWPRLHDAMARDPRFHGTFHVQNLAVMIQELESLRAVVQQQMHPPMGMETGHMQPPYPSPSPGVVYPGFNQGFVQPQNMAMPGMYQPYGVMPPPGYAYPGTPSPWGSPPVGQPEVPSTLNGAESQVSPLPPQQVASPVERETSTGNGNGKAKVDERVRSMTQEMDAEDIAAAARPVVQGQVLGNVMHVPPGMEHHLDGVPPSERKG